MKTHKVRPLLLESKDNEDRIYPCILKAGYMFGGKDELGYYDCNIRTPTIKMEIILISLEDEKIEVGDLVLRMEEYSIQLINPYKNCYVDKCTDIEENHWEDLKIIATQDQLSPELIQQLVDEYNKNGMQDFEIEMEEVVNCSENSYRVNLPTINKKMTFCDKCIKSFIPKLTNGFITVVEKELPVINFKNATLQDLYDRGFPKNNTLYTEEEVKQLLNKAIDHFCPMNNHLEEDEDKWFEQNKKK